jgi:tetratricopeptide (TPR) repeat protein
MSGWTIAVREIVFVGGHRVWFPRLIKVVDWLAARAARRGDESRAAQILTLYVKWRSNDPLGWAILGHALLRDNRVAEAEKMLREGLAIHPVSLELNDQLARVLVERNADVEAGEIWRHMQAAHPESPVPFAGLARLAARSDDLDQEVALVEQALRRRPDSNTQVAMAMPLLLVPSERDRAEALIFACARPLRRDPAYHLLVSILLEGKDERGAKEHLALANRYQRQRPDAVLEQIESLRPRLWRESR